MRLFGIEWDVTSCAGFLPFRPRGVSETKPVLAAAAGAVAGKAYVPLTSGADSAGVVELVFDVRFEAAVALDGGLGEAG